MEVNVGPSHRRTEICSESLKEEYQDSYTILLTITVYGQQDTVMNFIRFWMELDLVKEIKIGRLWWLGQTFRMQEWILAESLLFLKQTARDIEENLS